MKNTLHFTFLRTLMILAFGLFFNGAWAQETIIYQTGFENSEGFDADNVYNNSDVVFSGPTANRWGTFYGTPSATNAISGGQSLQMRSYNNNVSKGYTFTSFSLNGVTKVVFSGQNTSTLRVNLSYSIDNGVNWSTNTLFVLTSSKTEYTYPISNTGLQNVRIKFEVAFAGATAPTSTARVYIDDVKIYGLTTPTSTTWEAGNWSNGTPTASLDAIIAGDYSTASTAQGTFTAKSLKINSGVFTIASGTTVTVDGIVNNTQADSNLVIKSGGNLIQNTTVANTGAITVERNSAPIVRLDHTLWSSPVAAQNLYAFSPNTLTNRFYVYNTATDTYVTTGLSTASTFVPGKGFGVRAPNNHPTTAAQWLGSFKGIPNNGTVTFAASTAGTGFNLVGNPYPSPISATAFFADNATLNGTLYFYAHSLAMNADGTFPAGSNYSTWNSTGHTLATGSSVIPNGTIQVGQGFIVKATSAGDVTFTNSMRTADTNNQFFRTASQFTTSSEIEKHRLWLNLTNPEGTAFNQILIGYVAGATEGFDRGFDGLSFGNTGSFLSTKIDDADYVIQARSLPFQSSDVVPVSFTATTAGNYTISLSSADGLFAGDQAIFLKDKVTNTLNDLKSGSYTFTTAVGTFNNRFEVVYQTILSTPESDFTSNSIVAFKSANVLNVESQNFEIASVNAYDVQGRLVYSKSGINASSVQLSDLQVQNRVLLLQVTSTEGTSATIKVIY